MQNECQASSCPKQMGKNEIFSKEWCDLLFEHRNKEYGAYVLRARTGHRYGAGLMVAFALFLCVAGPSFVWWLMNKNAYKPPVDPIKSIIRLDGIRLKEARPARRPPQKADPKITAKAESNEQADIPQKDKQAVAFHPEDIALEPEKIEDLPLDSMDVIRKEDKLDLAKSTEQTTGVIMDSIPKYPSGIIAFMRWLDKTVVYPPDCIRRRIEGVVEVAFIVEPSGKISDARILKSAASQLDHEALRVIHLMPKWIPAQKDGKPIKAQVTLPIVFELSN